MSTAEAVITRKYGITFIDARNIVTEAKLNLNLHGYPNQEQKMMLVVEASKIFKGYPKKLQTSMQAQRDFLDAKKELDKTSYHNNSSPSVSTSCSSSSSSSSSLLGSSISDHDSYSLGYKNKNNDSCSSFASSSTSCLSRRKARFFVDR